jgi:hypothetical protein
VVGVKGLRRDITTTTTGISAAGARPRRLRLDCGSPRHICYTSWFICLASTALVSPSFHLQFSYLIAFDRIWPALRARDTEIKLLTLIAIPQGYKTLHKLNLAGRSKVTGKDGKSRQHARMSPEWELN